VVQVSSSLHPQRLVGKDFQIRIPAQSWTSIEYGPWEDKFMAAAKGLEAFPTDLGGPELVLQGELPDAGYTWYGRMNYMQWDLADINSFVTGQSHGQYSMFSNFSNFSSYQHPEMSYTNNVILRFVNSLDSARSAWRPR
jgi:hypothetical protein